MGIYLLFVVEFLFLYGICRLFFLGDKDGKKGKETALMLALCITGATFWALSGTGCVIRGCEVIR